MNNKPLTTTSFRLPDEAKAELDKHRRPGETKSQCLTRIVTAWGFIDTAAQLTSEHKWRLYELSEHITEAEEVSEG